MFRTTLGKTMMPKKQVKQHEEIEIIASSGNVYADTGHPNPEEAIQKKAAELTGVDQPKVSAIIRGQLSGFTMDAPAHLYVIPQHSFSERRVSA